MLLGEDTECFAFLAGHESFAAAEGAIGIANNANKARKKPLRVILNGLGKDAAQIIARINGFTYVQTQFDYFTSELNIVRTIPYSDGPRAQVNCYGADDVREGVAIMEREHNVVNSLYLTPQKLEDTNRERFARYDVLIAKEQRQELIMCDDADIVLVAFGAASRIARTAVRAARDKGIKAGLLRPISLWPFPTDAFEHVISGGCKAFLSVELNMETCVLTYDFDRFHADEILDLIARWNVTTLCCPPTMYRLMRPPAGRCPPPQRRRPGTHRSR